MNNSKGEKILTKHRFTLKFGELQYIIPHTIRLHTGQIGFKNGFTVIGFRQDKSKYAFVTLYSTNRKIDKDCIEIFNIKQKYIDNVRGYDAIRLISNNENEDVSLKLFEIYGDICDWKYKSGDKICIKANIIEMEENSEIVSIIW